MLSLICSPIAPPFWRQQADHDTMHPMRETVACPYCGEPNLVAVDEGGGSIQRYVEDCQVCCQPWEVTVRVGGEDEVDVELKTLDE